MVIYLYAEQQVLQRVGIVAQNHTGYVDEILSCLASGRVAVPLRSVADRYRIDAAQVENIINPHRGKPWLTTSYQPTRSEQPALIGFTSGTEGNPKGVVLSHNNLNEVISRLNAVMQVDGNIREYVGVPVYHSFGFGRCRAVATVGGQCFIPTGFNPAEIGYMLKRGDINAISAVPSLWRILLANQDVIGSHGQRVQWIEIGSQYMSRQEKEEMKRLFPNAHIVQHYGLTEASRTTLLDIHQQEGEVLESVGRALGTVEVRLTDEGRIAIRGEHVALAYLIDGKIVPLQDEDGWFVTKDMGQIEGDYLYYRGRADDVINCGGLKVNPEALEARVYAQLNCDGGLAICRKPDPLRGEGFLVAVTPEIEHDRQQVLDSVTKATQELGVNAGNAITVVEIDRLPTTATGKVQRSKLLEWYVQQEAESEPESMATATIAAQPQTNSIRHSFSQILRVSSVQAQDTFISLGGDSLSYVQLSIELERHLGFLPAAWETIPIGKLEQSKSPQRYLSAIETGILIRALSIIGVVVNHANLLALGGGAFFLLMLAGANFARFQSKALFQNTFVKPVASLLKNLILPYFIIALAFQIYKQNIDFSVLLLYNNYISIDIPTEFIFPIWFIIVLVQIILLFSLPFLHPAFRRGMAQRPWTGGLVLLALAVCAKQFIPYWWNTDYLYNRVPHQLIWLFILGWCIHYSQSYRQKIILSGLHTVLTLIVWGAIDNVSGLILVFGLLLIWVESIPVPKLIKSTIQKVSASAYYIYLTHMIFMHLIRNGLHVQNPWVNAGIGIVGGVVVWSVVVALQKRLSQTSLTSAEHSL